MQKRKFHWLQINEVRSKYFTQIIQVWMYHWLLWILSAQAETFPFSFPDKHTNGKW